MRIVPNNEESYTDSTGGLQIVLNKYLRH